MSGIDTPKKGGNNNNVDPLFSGLTKSFSRLFYSGLSSYAENESKSSEDVWHLLSSFPHAYKKECDLLENLMANAKQTLKNNRKRIPQDYDKLANRAYESIMGTNGIYYLVTSRDMFESEHYAPHLAQTILHEYTTGERIKGANHLNKAQCCHNAIAKLVKKLQDIEKVAVETPEKILKVTVDPLLGVLPYQARELAFGLGLEGAQIKQFSKIMGGLAKMFVDKDLSLLEINPLVITADADLLCLDAKINIDDNALYRQAELRGMWDPTQEDAREIKAKEWDLSYISLDGNIGCMVNGAGLAMATMDLIKLTGGSPANFLDVGGGATKERVTEAFKIILSDDNVKAVLVNIFGGIVRCDLIADGIIAAVGEVGVTVPVVVRLEGNNASKGASLLASSGLNIIPATSLQEAADEVVKAIGG